MNTRTTAWLAWSVCAVSLLIVAPSLLVILLGWSTQLPQGWTPWRDQVVYVVGIIGVPILGSLIASRRPANAYGWLWLCFGLGLTLQKLAEVYAAYALVVDPDSFVAPRTMSQLLGLGGSLALTLVPFLLLLFPTGRLTSRRWRFVAWIAAMSGVVLLTLNLFFAAVFRSVLSLVVRYHRARGWSANSRSGLRWPPS